MKEVSAGSLINKMKSSVREAVPVTGTLTMKADRSSFDFKAAGPGYLSLVISRDDQDVEEVHWYKDLIWSYLPSERRSIKSNLQNPFNPAELILIGFESAFSTMDIYASASNPRKTTFNRVKVYAVDVVTPGQAGAVELTLFISRETYLPVGFTQDRVRGIYSNVVPNSSLKKADFVWSPPKGVQIETLMVDRKGHRRARLI